MENKAKKPSNFISRLFTTIVLPPLLFSLIIFLPAYHHLAFCLFVVAVDVLASYEMQLLLFPKSQRKVLDKDGNELTDMPLIPFWLPCILPLMQYMDAVFFPQLDMIEFTLMVLILAAFALEITVGVKDEVPFSGALHRMSHTTMLIIYPSFMSLYFVKIAVLGDNPSILLILFFMLVFSNDVFCYVFGKLFGKSTRKLFAVSPNKSLAGYLGGTVMAVLTGALSVCFVPWINSRFSIAQGMLIGFVISIAADVGDLIESAFKRAVGVKDSGNVIPGRGGMLDCIDSLVASVPFFYLLTMELLK